MDLNPKITKRDISSFGKVLSAIGGLLENNPDQFSMLIKSLIDNSQENKLQMEVPQIDTKKIEAFPLFELAKSSSTSELMNLLSKFTFEELKYLIKFNEITNSRVKKKEKLITHITDESKKRTVDVFRHHP